LTRVACIADGQPATEHLKTGEAKEAKCLSHLSIYHAGYLRSKKIWHQTELNNKVRHNAIKAVCGNVGNNNNNNNKA
jgi:hypothetical protein